MRSGKTGFHIADLCSRAVKYNQTVLHVVGSAVKHCNKNFELQHLNCAAQIPNLITELKKNVKLSSSLFYDKRLKEKSAMWMCLRSDDGKSVAEITWSLNDSPWCPKHPKTWEYHHRVTTGFHGNLCLSHPGMHLWNKWNKIIHIKLIAPLPSIEVFIFWNFV